ARTAKRILIHSLACRSHWLLAFPAPLSAGASLRRDNWYSSTMTREELMARLVQQVRLGQSQIFSQHELILEQASRGEPTDLALSRLNFLQSLQTMRDQQLDRLHAARS